MSPQGSLPGVTMEKSHPTEMAAEIVAAFVSNNSVPRSELSALFETVHAAVKRLAEGGAVASAESPAPAVSIRKSVSPDYLILDDGLKFKSLRRHLSTLGMTPGQYCAKRNLRPTIQWSRPITQRSDPSWRSGWALGRSAKRPSLARRPSWASPNAPARRRPPPHSGKLDYRKLRFERDNLKLAMR